jgi:hypothetical protein
MAIVVVAAAITITTGILDLRDLVARLRGRPAPERASAPAAAPSPAIPAAAISELRVVTAPAGAEIFLDGAPRGVSPAVVLLPADGGAHRVTARAAGWDEASLSWTGAPPPLVALNLRPLGDVGGSLPRIATLVVESVAAGSTLRLVAPEARAIGPGTWAVAVSLPREGSAWGQTDVVLEARRADGSPAAIEAGAAAGTGTLRVGVTDSLAGSPVRVRVR